MLLNCDIERLDAVFDDFIQATGVYVSLLNEDLTYHYAKLNPHNQFCKCIDSCPEGFRACRASDRQLVERCRASRHMEMHTCHAGLVDVASPILHEGRILGYIILGQMKQEPDFSGIAPRLAALPLNPEEMKQHYAQLPDFDAKRIRGVANLAAMLAKHVYLEELVRPGVGPEMLDILEYVEQNLTEPLTVQRIAADTNVSKSALYKYFHQYYHCTIREYLAERRLVRSVALLRGTMLSIEEIALQTGFSSAAYYSRTFRKKYGLPPLQYRKQQKQSREQIDSANND